MRYLTPMRFCVPLLLAATLAACASQPQPPAPASATQVPADPAAPAATAQGSYPVPASATDQTGYPAPAPTNAQPATSGYPAPQPAAEIPEGPAFTIDLPLKAGQTSVSGTGPNDVPVRVVNMTRNAEELGRGVIGPDGSFSIAVSSLPAGDRVGLMIGDLTGTDLDPLQFLRGPGYEDIPQLGTFFAQALVEP